MTNPLPGDGATRVHPATICLHLTNGTTCDRPVAGWAHGTMEGDEVFTTACAEHMDESTTHLCGVLGLPTGDTLTARIAQATTRQ